MQDTATSAIAVWSNFYVITGSSAAALTGLMFVVITLVAGQRLRRSDEGVATFSTPTVVHFCAALFVSATLSAPWRSLVHAAVLLGLAGLYGTVYVSRVMFRTTRLTEYNPGVDDWVWYSVLPLTAYITIVVAAVCLPRAPTETLFAFAGANILLIFIGIHNAWDVVTYLAVQYDAERSDANTTENQSRAAPEDP